MSNHVGMKRMGWAVATGVAAALVVSGCGNDNNDGSNRSVDVALDPTSITVAPGASGSTTATISRGGSFAGEVDLTATGAPAGVTVGFTPSSIPAGETTSTIDVAVGAAVAAGTYPITISAAGTGVTAATATLSLTVGTTTAGPGVTLALNPTSLSVPAGGASATTTATITRTGGFTGGVNLAVTGAPAGLTATVAPNANVTASTATVTVQAGSGVAAGSYTLTLTATGTGIANATATLPVTVTGGGTGGGGITVAYCAADAPLWVAQQDGNGAWTQVNATSGSTYTFSFPSGRGGVATVDTIGTGYQLNVFYATTAEFTSFGGVANVGGCSSKSVNGMVAGTSATDVVTVTLGYATATVTPALSSNFTLTGVADGPQDLIAVRLDGTTLRTTSIILRRSINPAAGSTMPVLDFSTSEAFAPSSANVTVTGLQPGENGGVSSSFTGLRGSSAATLSFGSITGAPQPYDALPLARLNVGELQLLTAFASSGTGASRTAGVYFRSPSDQTIALGPALGTPTVSKAATAPYVRPRVQLASQAQYNRLLSVIWQQASLNRITSVFATANYFGTLPATWDVTVPDLSAAAGWNSTWALQDGTPITWNVSATGGAVNFIDANIADAATTASATVSSSTPLALRAGGPLGTSTIRDRLIAAVQQALASPPR